MHTYYRYSEQDSNIGSNCETLGFAIFHVLKFTEFFVVDKGEIEHVESNFIVNVVKFVC